MRSEDDYNSILTELKKIGVKAPKSKKFRSIVSKQEKALPQSKNKIFGVSLCDQEWTADSDYLLPKFIASSIAYLRNYINTEGLFRKAGSVARQRELRTKLEDGCSLEGSEPNDVASLLKQWLRELPESLIPNYLHDLFTRSQQLDSVESRTSAHLLTCLLLPHDHLYTLKYLLCFFGDVAANCKRNLMDVRNIAMIMAPNIFVMSADSADKSGPETMELHTFVLRILIENASKVGEVPASIQQISLEGKSCSELDSSGDFLDSSPSKSRKKRRSGPVQDLFNGIKKLVGQGTTPAPVPRSASKRKSEYNEGSLPKKLTIEVNGERTSSGTPKNQEKHKFVHSEGKAHTRKKSFGLLRRKERKRQKSVQDSPQSKMNMGVSSPFNWNVNVETNKINDSLQVPSPISPINLFSSDKALKCDSIKKSTSDGHLMVPAQKTFVMSVSSSQGELQNRPKASPYNLRTKFEGGQMQSLESIHLEMKSISENVGKSRNVADSPLASLVAESPGHDEVFSSDKLGLDGSVKFQRDDLLRKSSARRKAQRSQSHASKGVLNTGFVDEDPQSLLSETLVQLDERLSRRGMARSSHKNVITRQEAFIVKSKQKLKDSLDELESPEVSKPKSGRSKSLKEVKSQQVHKSESASIDSNGEIIGKKVAGKRRKTSRKGSLIRGRPNTIKSGLPTDVCQRFGNEFNLLPDANENGLPPTSDKTKEKKTEEHESREGEEKETCPPEEKDASLYLKFENFTLSSPLSAYEQNGQIPDILPLDATFGVFDNSSLKQDPKSLGVPSDTSQKRKLSLPLISGKEALPGLKNTHLRRSLDAVKRKISLPITPKAKSPRRSSCRIGKMQKGCTDTPRDLSALDFSFNDSCFKTPNRVPCSDSITWVSGNKYLGLDIPMGNEEVNNKRESIAMILKSKPGHVQAKVHLWDTKVRDSVYSTRSMPTFSTPTAVFGIEKSSANRKPLSVSNSCSSTGAFSTPNAVFLADKPRSSSQRKQSSSKSRKNHKLMLPPPPPKFVVSEPNTPSPNAARSLKVKLDNPKSSAQDEMAVSTVSSEIRKIKTRSSVGNNENSLLKEVTNISLEMNDSKSSPAKFESLTEHCKRGKRSSFSDNKNRSLKEVTNISLGLNDSKNSLNGSLKDDNLPMNLSSRKKKKRSSFSDNTPKKLSKKVSRSESSPCRPYTRVSRLQQQRIDVAENDTNRRLLRSSASKSGSCLSIEKLRSDQMIDEWQCEM